MIWSCLIFQSSILGLNVGKARKKIGPSGLLELTCQASTYVDERAADYAFLPFGAGQSLGLL